MFTRKDIKDIILSILIGATIAFLTTFLEGLVDWLRGMENNLTGAAGGMVVHSLRSWFL